jgi:hypothetical protein
VYQTCLLDIALAGAQGARVGLLHASFFISAAASSPSRIGDGQPNFLRSGSEGLRGDLPVVRTLGTVICSLKLRNFG